MPLVAHNDLPTFRVLRERGQVVLSLDRALEQDIRELAKGFDNETAPTVLQTSGRIFRLTGTLDTQYNEWRQILRQIFALETGLPAAE